VIAFLPYASSVIQYVVVPDGVLTVVAS